MSLLNYIKKMANILINTKSYVGRNVNIINGRVIVDGQDVTPDSKTITIQVDGNVDNLKVDACNWVKVSGDVVRVEMGAGDIECSDITGGARTGSGDISANNINGDVTTGAGDVDAEVITGSVKTGAGDINYSGK